MLCIRFGINLSRYDIYFEKYYKKEIFFIKVDYLNYSYTRASILHFSSINSLNTFCFHLLGLSFVVSCKSSHTYRMASFLVYVSLDELLRSSFHNSKHSWSKRATLGVAGWCCLHILFSSIWWNWWKTGSQNKHWVKKLDILRMRTFLFLVKNYWF